MATLASVVIQDLTYTETQLGLGLTISYTNGATAGSEVVTADPAAKTISIQIESGVSTAAQIRTAFNASTVAVGMATCTVSGTAGTAQVTCKSAALAGGFAAVKATLALRSGFYLEAVTAGTGGNSIRFKFTSGATAGSEVVTVSTNDITVQIADGVSTWAVIKQKIAASVSAAALVVVQQLHSFNIPAVVSDFASFTALTGGLAAVAPSVIVQDLTFASDTTGTAKNGKTVSYTTGATAGSEVVSVDGSSNVSVQIENGVSTATQIAAALNASAPYTGAKATGAITIVDYTKAGAVKASGTITIVDYTALAGKTVTVNGTVLTEGVDWTAAVDNSTTAASLELAVEAVTNINSTAASAVITVEAAATGTAGNAYTLATNANPNITLSGATLSGGRAATTVTVAGHALVADVDWNAQTNNNTTADNLAAAIDALTEVVAPNPAAAVIAITAASPGTAGNAYNLLTSNTQAVTVGAATMLGGTDSYAVTVSGTGATAQKTVNAAPTAGAVGDGPEAFFRDQSVTALTSSFVAFNWDFNPTKNLTIRNDETSGAKTVIVSRDGVNTHTILSFGESLVLTDVTWGGVFLKYGSAAPAYRLSAVGN